MSETFPITNWRRSPSRWSRPAEWSTAIPFDTIQVTKNIDIDKTGVSIIEPDTGNKAMQRVIAAVTITLYAWTKSGAEVKYTQSASPNDSDNCWTISNSKFIKASGTWADNKTGYSRSTSDDITL